MSVSPISTGIAIDAMPTLIHNPVLMTTNIHGNVLNAVIRAVSQGMIYTNPRKTSEIHTNEEEYHDKAGNSRIY